MMRNLNDMPALVSGNYAEHYEENPPTPGFIPGPDVNGNLKPYFSEGAHVYYALAPGVQGTGRIRGLASQNVIDIWLVERDLIADASVYPWSVITVPHTLLRRL